MDLHDGFVIFQGGVFPGAGGPIDVSDAVRPGARGTARQHISQKESGKQRNTDSKCTNIHTYIHSHVEGTNIQRVKRTNKIAPELPHLLLLILCPLAAVNSGFRGDSPTIDFHFEFWKL